MSQISGLLTGLAGLGLAASGLVLALLAGLRLLVVLRRPGKGRIARGIGVAGLVLLLCGAALLALEELDVLRHATDRLAAWLSGVAVVLAIAAGIRAGRRRRTPPAALAPVVEAPEEEKVGEAAEGPGRS